MGKDVNNKEWYELCSWIEINIFDYSKDQKLQTKACQALRGLQKGKAFGNNDFPDNGKYPFNIILMTFKANKILIQNALKNKTFDSEQKKMQYVCAIVRDKINDVYSRYIKAQKTQEKAHSADVSVMTNDGSEYKATERKTNKRLENLW